MDSSSGGRVRFYDARGDERSERVALAVPLDTRPFPDFRLTDQHAISAARLGRLLALPSLVQLGAGGRPVLRWRPGALRLRLPQAALSLAARARGRATPPTPNRFRAEFQGDFHRVNSRRAHVHAAARLRHRGGALLRLRQRDPPHRQRRILPRAPTAVPGGAVGRLPGGYCGHAVASGRRSSTPTPTLDPGRFITLLAALRRGGLRRGRRDGRGGMGTRDHAAAARAASTSWRAAASIPRYGTWTDASARCTARRAPISRRGPPSARRSRFAPGRRRCGARIPSSSRHSWAERAPCAASASNATPGTPPSTATRSSAPTGPVLLRAAGHLWRVRAGGCRAGST